MKASVHKTIASLIHHFQDGSTSRAVMDLSPSGETLLLRDKQIVRIHGTSGWKIRLLGGTVWITQDGDVRDVVLEAGESFIPDRDGDLFLSPFGEARVCLTRGTDCRTPVRTVPDGIAESVPSHAVPA